MISVDTKTILRLLVATAVIIPVVPGCMRDSTEQAGGSDRSDIAAVVESAPAVQTSANFTDRTADANVQFTYRNGQEAGFVAILESLGGGIALLDYDADGDVDLFIPGGGGFTDDRTIHGRLPGLFRNDGGFCFTDVTNDAGFINAAFYSHGVAAADYDNDGYPDLLITGHGGLLLYHNSGNGTFEQVAGKAGLNDDGWSSSAAWGDIDGDGVLDAYVAHYVRWSMENDVVCMSSLPGQREICPPRTYEPERDIVYAGNGDGTFFDASEAIGLRDDGKGLGVLIGDFDNDGDADVYVANDTTENFLYRNDGAGHLNDLSMLSATALSDKGVAEGSMGVELADFNLDGSPDLWVTNYERESIALYRNEGRCLFQYASQSAGVTAVESLHVGWGTVFFDFDRDGDEDVVVSNGHVVRYPENAPLRQKPLLFENDGGQRFRNVASAAGSYLSEAHMGRGVAAGDIDDDGDIDLVISHVNEPVSLLANDSVNANNHVSLRLIGTISNRSAIGARITLQSNTGRQVRQIKGGTSYASTQDPRVFFGLAAEETGVSIEIAWPSGVKQKLSDVPVNRMLTVIERSAGTDPRQDRTPAW